MCWRPLTRESTNGAYLQVAGPSGDIAARITLLRSALGKEQWGIGIDRLPCSALNRIIHMHSYVLQTARAVGILRAIEQVFFTRYEPDRFVHYLLCHWVFKNAVVVALRCFEPDPCHHRCVGDTDEGSPLIGSLCYQVRYVGIHVVYLQQILFCYDLPRTPGFAWRQCVKTGRKCVAVPG